MDTIFLHNLLLVGAGAVGRLPAAKLARLAGVDFRVGAAGERLKRYRRDGLFLNGNRLEFNYLDLAAPGTFRPELIILVTKGYQLAAAMAEIAPLVDDRTILLPLLNGISAAEILAARFPAATVLTGFFLGHASWKIGNEVRHDGVGEFVFGAPGPAARAVSTLFAAAGIAHRVPENLTREIWRKFILNVGVNQASGYFRMTYGELQNHPEALDFAEKLMREALEVGKKSHLPVDESLVDDAMKIILTMPPEARTSMYQDVVNSAPTEVDLFAGEICRRAKKLGINVPNNALVLKKLS